MAVTPWQFKFFDVAPVKLPDDSSSLLSEIGSITCIISGSESIFLGSADGTVRIVSQAFRVVRTFQAHDAGAITHMKQIEGTSLLVTIAEGVSVEPVLKVWALDKLEKKTGVPRCQSTLTVHNGRKQFPISAFAALDDLSQLAVGFANGAVTVVRGDLIHDRGARQRTVFESEEPITGIEFRQGSITTLYIATTARILTLVISGRGQGQPAKSLDEYGCGVGCMVLDEPSRDVIVARNDAIYYYGQHGRGPPFTYDGEKKLISTFKEYVVIVAPPRSNAMTRPNPLRAFGAAPPDDAFNTCSFTLLNTELRFVAHQEQLTSQVKAVVSEWGDLFVFTIDGKVYRYHEKSFSQKLEILYQRNLYVLAINLAQKAGLDSSQQNVILRKFGDYLYSKQDYDTAMQQYLKAIDNTEPSQVIRKFLDTQRIHNLIEYLEELHDHHKATADHTTLLLNCYAKLKDVEKLEEFIKSPDDLKFDLDTAISMCRQGGYYDQAAFLARKHGEHDLVVDVLIEDSKRFAEALAYIWRLEPEVAYYNLMKYATVLLQQIPKETTQLFIDYYTAAFRPKKDIIIIPDAPSSGSGGGIGMGLGVASSAVQNLAALLPLPYMNSNALASPSNGDQKSTISQAQIIETSTDEPVPQYKVPRPRTAFSAFVDHPQEFIVFLEACIKSDNLQEDDKVDLYTTLFEMYLHTASSKKNTERQEWENKAKNLIQGKDIPIDTSNVLLLSHLSDFRDGAILVREQQGLYFDIFRSFTAARDTQGAICALRKYGPEEPALYPVALAYFTSSPEILSEASDELDTVLKRIDEDGLMAPLQVIQTLSSNGVATMGMIKSYLSATIERERAEIASNRRTIETFRSDTETKKQELVNLTTKPVVFQTSRCQICSKPLELPVVHFLCKHSFHQSCLSTDEDVHDSEVECPICSANNATVKAIRRAQLESADRHDVFRDALKKSKDGFAVISEWFGRGVMGVGGAE